MRPSFLAIALLLGAAAAPLATYAQTCHNTEADKAAVAGVLRTMYAAATKDDLTLFHTVAAPGFYAFDNGERFEGDALMKMVKSFHDQGYVIVWSVDGPVVHIDCTTAWITYENHGSIQHGNAPASPQNWLESAVLHHDGTAWKLDFFSSARESSPAKY